MKTMSRKQWLLELRLRAESRCPLSFGPDVTYASSAMQATEAVCNTCISEGRAACRYSVTVGIQRLHALLVQISYELGECLMSRSRSPFVSLEGPLEVAAKFARAVDDAKKWLPVACERVRRGLCVAAKRFRRALAARTLEQRVRSVRARYHAPAILGAKIAGLINDVLLKVEELQQTIGRMAPPTSKAKDGKFRARIAGVAVRCGDFDLLPRAF